MAGGTVTGGASTLSFTPPFSGDAVLYLRQASGAPDTQRPTIAVTTPTTGGTFTTSTSPITLAGTASDDIAVTQVAWSNGRGGSGTATGTASWSVASVALQSGSNVLTVTARDAAGNTSTDTLTVTYKPGYDAARGSDYRPDHRCDPDGRYLAARLARHGFRQHRCHAGHLVEQPRRQWHRHGTTSGRCPASR